MIKCSLLIIFLVSLSLFFCLIFSLLVFVEPKFVGPKFKWTITMVAPSTSLFRLNNVHGLWSSAIYEEKMETLWYIYLASTTTTTTTTTTRLDICLLSSIRLYLVISEQVRGRVRRTNHGRCAEPILAWLCADHSTTLTHFHSSSKYSSIY